MKKYSYRTPVTTKPPSGISSLGRVVRAMSSDICFTIQDIYTAAFEPYENFECCKATVVTARARGYVELNSRETGRGRAGHYRLTDEGILVRAAIEARG